MKVLIGCEESGEVRRAFRALGHDAWSCDLQPSADGSPHHYQEDVFKAIARGGWDILIAHPPCTHLSLSGARWCVDHWVKRKNKSPRWHDGAAKRAARQDALEFFRRLWECDIPRVCLEQPMSMAVRVAPKSQEIHPWQFGHGECKTTWLWLRGLPQLIPTDIVPGRDTRIWRMAPGPERAKLRSRTYPGIARAMAEQWGKQVPQ